METDGIIHREVYREVPPKVEYSLTELGESLRPMILLMMEWATHNMEKVLEVGIRKIIGKSCRNKRCFPYVKTPFIFIILQHQLLKLRSHASLQFCHTNQRV